jgi:hypothetical protein
MENENHIKQAIVYLRIAETTPEQEKEEIAINAENIIALSAEIESEVIAHFFDKGDSNEGLDKLISHIRQSIPENLIMIIHGRAVVVQDFRNTFPDSVKAINFVKGSI